MNDTTIQRAPAGLDRRSWVIMAGAAAILMITMGMRQSLGLFIAPIIDSTHVGYAAMSFAMAVGQLLWGVAQPTFGALADRYGPYRVLLVGALMMSVGSLTPLATNEFALIMTIGVLTRPARAPAVSACSLAWSRIACPLTSGLSRPASSTPEAAGAVRIRTTQPVLISSITWMGAMGACRWRRWPPCRSHDC
jgi:MFS family permease